LKALYFEFFHIPEQGKIRDKVLMARVVLASVLIVLCMLSMSLSAYAFYAVGLTTHSTLKTANFEAQLEIQAENGDLLQTESEHGVYRLELEPDFYTLRLSFGGDAETGFCVIILNDRMYHTRQFFERTRSSDEMVLFLQIHETAELTVIPHWGTSSCYEQFSQHGDSEGYLLDEETLEAGTPPDEEPEQDLLEEESPDPLEDAEEQETETPEVVDLVQAEEEPDPLAQ